jgi:hypothetical protein
MNRYTIIFYLSILSHFPIDEWRIFGADAFEFLWMAQALMNATEETTWLINIFSYFGLYPYSHYPVFVPYLLGMIFNFNEFLVYQILVYNIILNYILFKILISIVKEFSDNQNLNILSASLFIFAPIWQRQVHFTTAPRLYLFILQLLFIKIIINYDNQKISKSRLLFYSGLLFIIGMFTHRLAFFFLFYVFFILIALFIFSKHSLKNIYHSKILNNNISFLIYLVINILMIVLSFQFLYIDPNKINSPWFDNNGIGTAINLTIDLILRLGYIFPLYIVGLFIIFKNNVFSSKSPLLRLYVLLITPLLSVFLIFTLYSTVIFVVLFWMLANYTIYYFYEKIEDHKFFSISSIFLTFSSIGFLLLYNFLVTPLIFFSIYSTIYYISFIIIIILTRYANKIIRFNKDPKFNYKFLSIILSILLFSSVVTFGSFLNDYNNPYSNTFTSNEINEVITIIDKDYQVGDLIYSANLGLGRILEGIGGYAFVLPTSNGHQNLYYNWVNSSDVQNLTSINFSISFIIKYSTFFEYPNNYEGERAMYDMINYSNVSTNEGVNKLKELNVRYVVSVIIDGEISVYSIRFSVSPLLQSLVDINYAPIFRGDEIVVWNLNELLN